MFRSLRLDVALLLWIALATAATGQTANWHTFTDISGRFSFLVPAEPKHQSENTPSNTDTPVVTDIYLVTEPGFYIAGLTQYPPAVPLPDQEELNLDRDNFNKGVKATTISEERKTFSGFPATEFKSKNDQMTFRALVVKADHRVYMLVAAYSGATEPAECGKFVNSLKLIKP